MGQNQSGQGGPPPPGDPSQQKDQVRGCCLRHGLWLLNLMSGARGWAWSQGAGVAPGSPSASYFFFQQPATQDILPVLLLVGCMLTLQA